MATVKTGLGTSVSAKVAALIISVVSSLLLLAVFVALGQDPAVSLFEVTIGGIISGITYYAGVSARSDG
ncbi:MULTISPECIES: hypothetical protein [Halobacterium]|uniref:Uncharacterized protein n=4 Tax=Halobacterium salinarum TaxID=2242 RepID=A0A510NB68_HALSA|nr:MULTISPECIES: hypothetical protein [Halobacterium]MBB6090530.1 hypothetical protein [Halobacterium salinarum]MCF2166296.1 hypothetical protein [Halobacterium salinarum]MCF2168119.1 hypothetical protein [Halobacterium salinarum]MCF2208352.1 hypothetical protein [Halobacterium salinarum]MCF2239762.1 hypothetical protein [Halobacterium salinarum]